eukprot:3780096-Amphidinium_carterae.1
MSEASKGDSSGNGLAEHSVRELKAKTRGLRLQVEELHNITLVLRRCCGLDGTLRSDDHYNIGRRGPDGRTAWVLGVALRAQLRSTNGRVQ